MRHWRTVMLTAAFLLAVFAAIGMYTAQGSDDKPKKAEDYDFLPVLLPPDSEAYMLQTNKRIVSPDKRSIAQFVQPSEEYNESIEVFTPSLIPLEDSGQMAYTFLASVRYTGKKGVAYVTTIRPSIPLTKPILGEEVMLTNGKKSIFIKDQSNGLNQFSFMDEDLIISIVAPLSQGQLKQLAETIIIVKE